MNISAQELPLTPSMRSSALRAAQMTGTRNALVKPTARRSSNRRLVKIRARAGDTLSLLGDRFGASAEDIAGLNGIAVNVQLQAGHELMIPLPSSELLTKISAEKLTQHNSGDVSGTNNVASSEAGDSWENVQGVLFRKGNIARSSTASLAKVVEVSEAERSPVAQPVWIYLVGGARVEADSVNETTEGVWYARGNLSIFIERSRIERVERERTASVSEEPRSWIERGWSTGNMQFDALIKENGARYGVDPYLIFCVMEQESHFKPKIVSPKGARGLMQLMPGTAAHFGVRNSFDPAENIMGGTKYLKQLLGNFNGRVDLVLAGYNAGEGAVKKYGGNVPPYNETRNYVKRISQRYGQSRSVAAPAIEPPVVASRLR
ncbi:MAG: transglycosylase SLT domain-containing protein [Acidobacteria bacterium]|nr:transglycosylase SLT domain-containing protein [Acidobacteriota bacterium]